MALKKRGKLWHLRIRPFGGKQIWISTGTPLKSVAENVERQILVACGSQDYRSLDPVARKACLQMFRNQGWRIPGDLSGEEPATEEMTLRKAMELCLRYPEVRNCPNRDRMEQNFVHLTDHFGSEFPVGQIWIPQIKEYQVIRTGKAAAPATVNREKSALSKLFQVLIELRHMDVNPARLVKPLSEKFSKRQAYIGYKDFQLILGHLPSWFRPISQAAYYSGMRRGVINGLNW